MKYGNNKSSPKLNLSSIKRKSLFSTLLLIVLVTVLLPTSAHSLIVEINNIHNGYKHIIKAIPAISPQQTSFSSLRLQNTQIIENTLPGQQNIEQILKATPTASYLNLYELSQLTDLSAQSEQEIPTIITTNWIKKPHYTVIFNLQQESSQDSLKIFKKIRDNTKRSEDIEL